MHKRYNKNKYLMDKDNMDVRQRQPRPGNYRIDAEGNPLDTLNYNKQVLNPDTKKMKQSDRTINGQIESVRPPRNYRIDDYDKNLKAWQNRSQQPNVEDNPPLIQSRRMVTKANSVRNKRNYKSMTKPKQEQKSIYHQFLNLVTNRTKKRDGIMANLPGNRLQLLFVFATLFLIFILSGRTLLPNRWVNQLVVTGQEYIHPNNIIQSSRIHSMDQISRVMEQKDAIENKIKKEIPLIENVSFIRKNWNALELKVTEYEIVALIEEQGEIMPVMSNGEILEMPVRANNNNGLIDYLPKLLNFKQKGKVSDLTNNALRSIDQQLLTKIESISSSDNPAKPNSIIVKMKDGNEVHAIINTFAQKMAYYDNMVGQLDGVNGVIDLEVGAYFTPYDNANSDNNMNNLDNNQN